MKKLWVVLLICLLFTVIGTPVLAKEELRFNATRVFWDGPNRLAVEGNFENTGTKTITGVSYLHLDLFVLINGDYYRLTQGAWVNDQNLLSVVLKPGQRSSWTFYLSTEAHPSFVYWVVDWKLEYNYLN